MCVCVCVCVCVPRIHNYYICNIKEYFMHLSEGMAENVLKFFSTNIWYSYCQLSPAEAGKQGKATARSCMHQIKFFRTYKIF